MQSDGDVLNKCLEAIHSNRATIEECLRQYPEYFELGMLLQAALAVQESPKVTLSAASKSELRQRMLAHFDAQPVRKPERSQNFKWFQNFNLRLWFRPAFATLATFIVIFAGGGSLLHAASQALPGDALYGLKRASEQVQLSLADDQSRVAALDQIANTRLDELAVLASRNDAVPASVLNDISASITDALNVEPNAAKRSSLLDKTANVMQQAATDGAISVAAETKFLAAVNSGTPAKAMSTVTPTATLTATPTATFTVTPTPTESPDAPEITPSPEFTDAPVGQDNSVLPKPTKPYVVPIHPTHPPTPIHPTSSADNGNGNGNGNSNGNGNGNGNGKGH